MFASLHVVSVTFASALTDLDNVRLCAGQTITNNQITCDLTSAGFDIPRAVVQLVIPEIMSAFPIVAKPSAVGTPSVDPVAASISKYCGEINGKMLSVKLEGFPDATQATPDNQLMLLNEFWRKAFKSVQSIEHLEITESLPLDC